MGGGKEPEGTKPQAAGARGEKKSLNGPAGKKCYQGGGGRKTPAAGLKPRRKFVTGGRGNGGGRTEPPEGKKEPGAPRGEARAIARQGGG